MLTQRVKQLRVAIKSIFAPKGLVGPHTTSKEWDEQFNNHKWDYLGDDNQREHYNCILDLYKQFSANGSMLDIGCGEGLLYRYSADSGGINAHEYYGVDISQVAINMANESCPTGKFKTLNYQNEHIDTKYDVVIFNETLYYFDHAGKTLQKCCNENLAEGGVIIISMCDHERHDLIWKLIDDTYKILDSRKSVNEEGIRWTIKVLKP